jgi:lipopolysaccharide transport protein LptA
MSKRCLLGPLALLCAAALPAFGQQHADSTATPSSSKKSDPTGMGISTKNRPKNAKTEITCKNEATFDNTNSIATFDGTVFVKDPQFNLYCDKLVVYLNKERKGIEHAEAIGHVVVVQENTNDKGETSKSIGRAGKAVFVPATGEATLTDWPQLQQGINNHISTEQTTVMILHRDGQLKTVGGSKTVIVDQGQ